MSSHSDRIHALEGKVVELTLENDRLRDLVHRDELTGLGNRRSFRNQLGSALAYAARYGGSVAVLVIDLDGMKALNDEAGHPEGDQALQRIADILARSLRQADQAARLGGDEFALVMPGTTAAAAVHVAERVRERIETLILRGGHQLTASIGIAAHQSAGGEAPTARELFARADAAMYEAKRRGKNCVCIAAEPGDSHPPARTRPRRETRDTLDPPPDQRRKLAG
jgi:diguanylate cyclase (GGDEF)-like protein